MLLDKQHVLNQESYILSWLVYQIANFIQWLLSNTTFEEIFLHFIFIMCPSLIFPFLFFPFFVIWSNIPWITRYDTEKNSFYPKRNIPPLWLVWSTLILIEETFTSHISTGSTSILTRKNRFSSYWNMLKFVFIPPFPFLTLDILS